MGRRYETYRYSKAARTENRSFVETHNHQWLVSFRRRSHSRKVQCFWCLLCDSDSTASYHQKDEPCLHHKCNLRQLNDATYVTKHASFCSGTCDVVAVDPDDLAAILIDQDKIPLIGLSQMSWSVIPKTQNIEVQPWDGSKPFVAISHVWADGLGNPNANALPRCQMQSLDNMIRSLTGRIDIPFWLDMICVPPNIALKNLDPIIDRKQRQA